MNEMEVQPVDLGDELVEPVERGFALAPVVFIGPVGGQLAGVVQRNPLGPVVHAFPLGPPGAGKPVTQIGENLVRYRRSGTAGYRSPEAEGRESVERLLTGVLLRCRVQFDIARCLAHRGLPTRDRAAVVGFAIGQRRRRRCGVSGGNRSGQHARRQYRSRRRAEAATGVSVTWLSFVSVCAIVPTRLRRMKSANRYLGRAAAVVREHAARYFSARREPQALTPFRAARPAT